jgi:glycosyltransferase involved in cell wall biosynthesis
MPTASVVVPCLNEATSIGRLPVRLLSLPAASIPAQLNAGIRQTRGDVIVRFDGHSAPDSTYISTALVTLEAPGAGVVGGAWKTCVTGHGSTRTISSSGA